MSNLIDFIGGSSGSGSVIKPVKQNGSMQVMWDNHVNAMPNPDNSGNYLFVATEDIAWQYASNTNATLWSVSPSDLGGSTIAGVCWYSPDSVLFLATNESNTVYLREVTVSTGTIEGVSVDLSLTCTTAGNNEYSNGIFHREDGGFYLCYSEGTTIVDNSFNIVSTIATSSVGFPISDSVSILFSIDVRIPSVHECYLYTIINNNYTLTQAAYGVEKVLGLITTYQYVANLQNAFTYYNGITVLPTFRSVVDSKDLRRGLLEYSKIVGAL